MVLNCRSCGQKYAEPLGNTIVAANSGSGFGLCPSCQPAAAPMGWICPRCHVVHAPSVLRCECRPADASAPMAPVVPHGWSKEPPEV